MLCSRSEFLNVCSTTSKKNIYLNFTVNTDQLEQESKSPCIHKMRENIEPIMFQQTSSSKTTLYQSRMMTNHERTFITDQLQSVTEKVETASVVSTTSPMTIHDEEEINKTRIRGKK
jgi:hypothetical protein